MLFPSLGLPLAAPPFILPAHICILYSALTRSVHLSSSELTTRSLYTMTLDLFFFLLLHASIPLPNLRKVHFACHSYRVPEQRYWKTAGKRMHPANKPWAEKARRAPVLNIVEVFRPREGIQNEIRVQFISISTEHTVDMMEWSKRNTKCVYFRGML